MDVKDRALQEIRMIDDLFRRLQLAHEFRKEMEVALIEAEIDSHVRTCPDLIKSLLKLGDLESFRLIHSLESHRRDFMTRTTSATDLSQIPSSAVELEIPPSGDHKEIYEPVDSSERLSSVPTKTRVSVDFCASLGPTLLLCIIFSVLWSAYAR
jgi:hypothetical protein